MIGPGTGFDVKLPVETIGFEIGTEIDGPDDTIVFVFSLEDSFFFCDRRNRNSS